MQTRCSFKVLHRLLIGQPVLQIAKARRRCRLLPSNDCELAATFVTQWKAYPISTSLICTTG